MKGLPWFAFYAADFLNDRDVQDMSIDARGLLFTCIAWQWIRGPLPRDLTQLARITQMDPADVERLWPILSTKEGNVDNFRFIDMGDGWAIPRLEAQRLEAVEAHEKRVRAGRAGGIASGERRRSE